MLFNYWNRANPLGPEDETIDYIMTGKQETPVKYKLAKTKTNFDFTPSDPSERSSRRDRSSRYNSIDPTVKRCFRDHHTRYNNPYFVGNTVEKSALLYLQD
jgi:hypothetical protein